MRLRRIVTCLGVLAVAIVAPLSAQESAPSSAARDSVLAVVQRFFDAMTAHDSAGLAAVLHPEGQGFALFEEPKDSVRVSFVTNAEFPRRLTSGRQRLVERIWEPIVHVRGPLAMVWAPYDFHRDGRFSHCGADLFTLVRQAGQWRIAQLSFTMEPEGCAPSPLGPLQTP